MKCRASIGARAYLVMLIRTGAEADPRKSNLARHSPARRGADAREWRKGVLGRASAFAGWNVALRVFGGEGTQVATKSLGGVWARCWWGIARPRERRGVRLSRKPIAPTSPRAFE